MTLISRKIESNQSLIIAESLISPFYPKCMYSSTNCVTFFNFWLFCACFAYWPILEIHRMYASVVISICSYMSTECVLYFNGSPTPYRESTAALYGVRKQVFHFWSTETVSLFLRYWSPLWLRCIAIIFRSYSIDWWYSQCQRKRIWVLTRYSKILALLEQNLWSG